MEAHHIRVIERLTEQFKDDARYPALIIGGSLAKGWGGVYSDVDVMLVAGEEEYARCVADQQLAFINRDICDYPGGYVDGKVIDLQFLKDVADHGSEPARAAFTGVFLAYSRIPQLDELLQRIPVYQEAEREEKIKAFYSQVRILNWFVGDVEKRNMLYPMAHATCDMVFYAARLLLAYNRILYPYHKWLMREVERAPEKPEHFLALAEALLKHGSSANAQALYDCIEEFRDWGVSPVQAHVRFLRDSEWNWRDKRPPLYDW